MHFFGIDLLEMVRTVGYVGLTGIIFAETGLFIGFFFPGDSVLFVAGILAAEGFFNLPLLLGLLFVAGVLGNIVGYWFGWYVGPKLFAREDSLLFKKSHLLKAQAFYEKYGAKTIVLARFIPIIRTFAPIVAGAANMRYGVFFFYNVLGGFLWTVGLTSLAYYLGSKVENIDRYLLLIVVGIVFLSILPGLISYWRERQKTLRGADSESV